LVTGRDYAIARGTGAPIGDSEFRQSLSEIAHWTLFAVLIVGIIRALTGGARRTWDGERAAIALIWFAAPVAMMSYVGQVVHPFYLLIGLPAGHVLAAQGIAAVLRPQTRIGAASLIGLAIPFAALMGINSARYAQETAALPGAHGLGALPLDYGLELGAAIRQQSTPTWTNGR
jgi:hypothetical protein